VLASAFVDDPLLRWIFPTDAARLDCAAAWMGLFVEEYLQHGRVDTVMVDGEIVGVALWRVPGTAPLVHPEVPSIPGLLAALVGPERAAALGRALHAFSERRPAEPYAYLQFLAVAPSHQGRQLGGRLIQPGLDAAAQLGLDPYLETTNGRNLPFYLGLGFAVTAEFTLDLDGPRAWCLRRAPSTDATPNR
jgi:GNAT superfamily N-acetyltransferase